MVPKTFKLLNFHIHILFEVIWFTHEPKRRRAERNSATVIMPASGFQGFYLGYHLSRRKPGYVSCFVITLTTLGGFVTPIVCANDFIDQ
jgi:hypothetical protein